MNLSDFWVVKTDWWSGKPLFYTKLGSFVRGIEHALHFSTRAEAEAAGAAIWKRLQKHWRVEQDVEAMKFAKLIAAGASEREARSFMGLGRQLMATSSVAEDEALERQADHALRRMVPYMPRAPRKVRKRH